MGTLLRLAEKLFTIFALILFSGALVAVVSGGSQVEGNFLFQALAFAVYAITFCLLAVQSRGFTRIPSNTDIPILLLTGVAVFSYHWSTVPSLTLRRSVALVGTTLFGIYFATRYSPKEQLRLLAWTFGIGALLSLVFALALPQYGLDMGTRAWRGVYVQKNALGNAMSLSSVVFLLTALSSHRYRWIAWLGFGLSFALLVLSTSKTSLVTFLVLLILLPFYRALRWQYTRFLPLFIIGILIIASLTVWIISEAETFLGFIGKDITLTGRTSLWEAVIAMIQQRPWLGYGYSGFWLGWNGDSAYIWQVFSWLPPHAHSGILDLWLDLGLLGVLIFALTFFRSLVKAIALARHGKTLEEFWPLLYLTSMLLFNLTYSTILTRNNIAWVLYVALNFWKPVQHYHSAKSPIHANPNKGHG